MAREQVVTVPDIGDFKDVAVIEVLVKAGETSAVEAPVIVLETEPEQLLKVLVQHERPVPGPAGRSS